MTQVANEDTREGFAGTLRHIQLTDVIQMCCLAGASLCIRVRQDSQSGTIFVSDGEIVHAQCGQMVGAGAFFTILGWKSGLFETLDEIHAGQPSIKEPCQFLLMEAARLADEQVEVKSAPEQVPQDEPQVRLRVLIVDDSPIMAKILASMMAADPGIEVVGSARNGEEALTMMKSLSPDLITMDVNMPVMGGSTALKHIMIESPCPVMIMSNLGPSSFATILTFLNLGAVDFMSKPVKHKNILLQQQRIVERVHLAAKANVGGFRRIRPPRIDKSAISPADRNQACRKLVILNSGVGGYFETVQLLTSLPAESNAGVVSLQSIPPQFAPTLAGFLNTCSFFDIQALLDSGHLCARRCFIAAHGQDFDLCRDTGGPVILKQAHGNNSSQGADGGIDRLLTAAADVFRECAVVFLLSGCDLGGLEGLRRIKEAGGRIIAPQMEQCILPASLQPAFEADLIDEAVPASGLVRLLQLHSR